MLIFKRYLSQNTTTYKENNKMSCFCFNAPLSPEIAIEPVLQVATTDCWGDFVSEDLSTLPIAISPTKLRNVHNNEPPAAVGVMSPMAFVMRSIYRDSEVVSFRKQGYEFSCDVIAATQAIIATEVEDMVAQNETDKNKSKLGGDYDDVHNYSDEMKSYLKSLELGVDSQMQPQDYERMMFIASKNQY